MFPISSKIERVGKHEKPQHDTVEKILNSDATKVRSLVWKNFSPNFQLISVMFLKSSKSKTMSE